VQLFSTLPPATIAQHKDQWLPLVNCEEIDVRLGSLQVMASLDAPRLQQHSDLLLEMLSDSDQRVRARVVTLLGQLDPVYVSGCVPVLVEILECGEEGVQRAAKEVLITLPPATLEEHLGLLLPLLQHASPPSPMPGLKRCPSVMPAGPGNARLNALEVMNQLDPSVLFQHTSQLVEFLEDHSRRVRAAAIKALLHSAAAAAAQDQNFDVVDLASPELFAISRDDLDHFAVIARDAHRTGLIASSESAEDSSESASIKSVVEYVVKPITLAVGEPSWAAMRHRQAHSKPHKADSYFFCSHCWSDSVLELHRQLAESWPKPKDRMWIACLSHPVHGASSNFTCMSLLQENMLTEALFARAVTQASSMLMLPNSLESVFTRMWCLIESTVAVDAGVPVVVATASLSRRGSAIGMQQETKWSPFLRPNTQPSQGLVSAYAAYEKAPRPSSNQTAPETLQGHFISVRFAVCSELIEQEQLLKAIQGQEDRIDDIVNNLRSQCRDWD